MMVCGSTYLQVSLLVLNGMQILSASAVVIAQDISTSPSGNNFSLPLLLTFCEIWESGDIPITPAIELAMESIQPYFGRLNIRLHLRRQEIPAGCGYETTLAVGPSLVSLMGNDSGCSLIIGPGCTEALYNIRGLAMSWNIPMVTSGASGLSLGVKMHTPVLTRFGQTYEDLSRVLVRLLDHFNWTNTVLLCEVDDLLTGFQRSYQDVLRKERSDLYRQMTVLNMLLSGTAEVDRNTYIMSLLRQGNERARVFIVSARQKVLDQVLVMADQLGMLNGDHVFIATNFLDNLNYGIFDLTYYSSKKPRLYDSLLVIQMKGPNDDNSARNNMSNTGFLAFSDSIRNISAARYHYTYGPEEDISQSVLGTWDAVMLYAAAANATFSEGGDIHNGRVVTAHMWNHSFHGSAIDTTISGSGDRSFPYFLLDLDPTEDNPTFKPALLFKIGNDEPEQLRPVHWPFRTSPPPNLPACMYTSDRCKNTLSSTVTTVLAVVLPFLVIFSLALGYIAYQRQITRDKVDAWRIPGSALVMRNDPSSRPCSRASQDTLSVHLNRNTSHMSSAGLPCATALYNQTLVAMKDTLPDSLTGHLNSATTVELRALMAMMHSHLAHFYGVCIESTGQFLITEFFSRGSLTDLLAKENITLDWAFKYSLMGDIIEGLTYITKTSFKSHGRLTSNNCLVDNHFVVKISDLGLSHARPSYVVAPNNLYSTIVPENILRSLLWRAPELLRAFHPRNGTPKGDIYSTGIVLSQIIERCNPYESLRAEPVDVIEVVQRVRDVCTPAYRPYVPTSNCSQILHSIMLKCWEEDPVNRPTIEVLSRTIRNITGNQQKNFMDSLFARMEKYANDLEDMVFERTAAFAEEKKRSENLLYQMLPKDVANCLKAGQLFPAEAYESATVYFSDITEFDLLSSTSSPVEIVNFLNDLYTLLDGVIESYDVYKVETISDSYMVASGLPRRNANRHAREIAKMALHILNSCIMFRIRHQPGGTLSIRAGIHTGPCAAGVVGVSLPRYCIFGDTVNVASRMLSTSEPLKIHTSLPTWQLLSSTPEFVFEQRGEVHLKGRGTMHSYWLTSATPLNLPQQS